jgi:hypothetical protein
MKLNINQKTSINSDSFFKNVDRREQQAVRRGRLRTNSIYVLYWYKSTKIDAEGAARWWAAYTRASATEMCCSGSCRKEAIGPAGGEEASLISGRLSCMCWSFWRPFLYQNPVHHLLCLIVWRDIFFPWFSSFFILLKLNTNQKTSIKSDFFFKNVIQ